MCTVVRRHLPFVVYQRNCACLSRGITRSPTSATRFAFRAGRLTAIITLRCLRGCEPCQFSPLAGDPRVHSTYSAANPLARRNTAVEFSINNVSGKLRRKTGGRRCTHGTRIERDEFSSFQLLRRERAILLLSSRDPATDTLENSCKRRPDI